MLLQSAGVVALALAVLGDLSSASALAAAVPAALIQAQHSRDSEREADAFARIWLHARGLPEAHFDAVLCRLEQWQRRELGPDPPAHFGYLASHPPTAERARCPGGSAAARDP